MSCNAVIVVNRRRGLHQLKLAYPDHIFCDVTKNSSDEDLVQLSPFYPHAGIPVPFSSITAESVEGLWQGLKVFSRTDGAIEDIDTRCLSNRTQKGIKRTLRAKGRSQCLGHRCIDSGTLLDYTSARRLIYMPAYRFVLEHRAQRAIHKLIAIWRRSPIVLLDYSTNVDIDNILTPLSHAGLVRDYMAEITA
jgi:hypothetical protein